ncbi:hypothetical protein PLANTIT3_61016 [Plantibacter sp. T3]|nr:hypothetical protein PLANTIT3_61016 [Plantibacter sp. T3]
MRPDRGGHPRGFDPCRRHQSYPNSRLWSDHTSKGVLTGVSEPVPHLPH